MRIGVDLDGVIVDLLPVILDRWNKEHGSDFKPEDQNGYFLWETAGVSKQYFNMWWDRHVILGLYSEPKMFENAWDFLKDLQERQHEIVIITSRMACQPIVFEETVRYIHRCMLPMDELHFTTKKHLVLVDMYLEDSPDLVRDLESHGKLVLVPDRPWNRSLADNGHYRFFSFSQALDIIDSYQDKRSMV